ncbi:uncharacterized protein IWZ02DRAFT_520618 [Phyllosticta citriasiana]|uniref:uncharacterized protein n=1 Tax=Phyllosticta citriasiana TaxID=595635 RepID=UPI0030FDAD2C
MGKPDDTSFEEAVREGDRLTSGPSCPEGVYQIAFPTTPHVFFPPKAMKELSASTSCSFQAYKSDILLDKYSYRGEENLVPRAVIRAMSNNLDVVIKSFGADVAYAFETVFGSCDDWTTVDQIWPSTFRIASIMSSRPILGKELSRDTELFAAVTEYFRTPERLGRQSDAGTSNHSLFFESRLPWIHALVKARDQIEDLMMPVIQRHLDRYIATGKDCKSRGIAAIHSDGGELLDWMIPEYLNPVPKKLARDEVTIILKSVMNISGGLSHSLFNFFKYSEYHDPLGEEYEEGMMREFSGLNKAAVFKMKKMESFMKGTHRLNPPSINTGHYEKSCRSERCVALHARASPTLFPEPKKFDGYRFHRMRQVPGEEFRHQLTSTSNSEIIFSLGGHAYPGRIFFPALEKAFLSLLLTHYDVRVKPDHENEDSSHRSAPQKEGCLAAWHGLHCMNSLL